MPTIERLSYSPCFLKSLSNDHYIIESDLQDKLNEIQMYRKRTKRGCRAGRNLRRKIQILESYRPHSQPSNFDRGVNLSNLTKIDCLNLSASHHTSTSDCSKHKFPSIVLTNAQSLGNKFDEFELLLDQESIDVGVVTESWFRPDLPDFMLTIDGFELFSMPLVTVEEVK
jgi:hypothetical protein